MKVKMATFERSIKAWINKSIKGKMESTVQLLCKDAKGRFLMGPPRRDFRPIVDTGRLRESLTWEVRDDGLVGWYGSNRAWRGENSVYYGVYLELGFRHWRSGKFIGPYPFLRPPLTRKKNEVQKIWGREEEGPTPKAVLFVDYER